MKNIFLLLFCVAFLSCSKTDKKEEVIPQEIKEKEITIPAVEVVKDKLVFTIQIAALKKANNALTSIENLAVFQENSLVKYRLGAFDTYKEARNSRAQLISVYKDAFVQALLNDVPIPIKEALQY
jgi:type I restriction-modification system DNA methylase subunit